MSNARISRIVDVKPEMTLKEFGRALLAKLWEVIEADVERFRHRKVLGGQSWTWFRADANRLALGVLVANCRGEFDEQSPSRRRWPGLSIFVGPGKGFQVAISEDEKHVVLMATSDMMHVLGYERKLVSPFELKPFDNKPVVPATSQTHYLVGDLSLEIPTIKDIGKLLK